jgi:hypothetical protein
MCDDKTKVLENRDFDRKTQSRQKFVICFLVFHLLLTISAWRFPGYFRDSLLSWIYANYFVTTSIPTVFVLPFLPDSLRSSTVVFACLLINGVISVWIFSTGLHHILYRKRIRSETVKQENADSSLPITGDNRDENKKHLSG